MFLVALAVHIGGFYFGDITRVADHRDHVAFGLSGLFDLLMR